MPPEKSSHSVSSIRNYLGVNRNVGILAASTFGLGLGEELWQAYLPKYLVEFGASSIVVGMFASTRDLLDGLYQYPGGWVTDHYGRKRALMLFTTIAMAGYAVFVFAGHWAMLFAGLALVMGWKSGAFPASFAVIGDALPRGQRSVAFSVQSILVRIPRVIGAPLGGLMIVGLGMVMGMRLSIGITLALAAVVLFVQYRYYNEERSGTSALPRSSFKEVYRSMPLPLKRLLLAECFVRIGEGISLAFIVLYVIDVHGFSASSYGVLYAIQQTVAIALYIPSGKIADISGRRILVALTFLFFAIFPLAVSFSQSFLFLVAAFVLGGLKEFGEPARKSYIVDLSNPQQVGRTVGLYYTIRNLLVVPAGTIGGMLWQISPNLTLSVSCAVGFLGFLVFLMSGKIRES